MTWSLAVLGFFVHIDAQRDPLMALVALIVAGGTLWFIATKARQREERKLESERRGGNRPNRTR